MTPTVVGRDAGIGLAVSRALLDEGAHVVAAARSSSAELDDLKRRSTSTADPHLVRRADWEESSWLC